MKTTLLILLQALIITGSLVAAEKAAPTPVAETYRLMPQDKVTYLVEEDPEQAKGPIEVMVNALGDLNFPISQCCPGAITINTRGKTLAAVQQELRARLEAEFYQKPTLHLKLQTQSQKPGEVLFSGQVRATVFQLPPGEQKSLYEVLTKVGTTEFANLKKVKINRTNPLTGTNSNHIINIEAVKKGDRTKDFMLQDGDRVDVPEAGIIFK